MSVVPASPEDYELLAAELAFGLLDPPERSIAELRLVSDPDFAAAHRRWQDRAVGLFVDADVEPPAGMWDAILTRLPANDVGSDARLLTRIRRWQGISAAAAILAIVSTAALLLHTRPTSTRVVPVPVALAAPRPLVAVLASVDRPAAVAIGYDPVLRRLTVLPSRLTSDGRAAELWVIPAGGVPHAVSVVAAAKPGTHLIPSAIAALIAPGATLAISLEPAGGSPTGQPTGPVVLTGSIIAT